MAQIEILKASFGIAEEQQQRPERSTITFDEGSNPDGSQDLASVMTKLMPSNDLDALIPDGESTHWDDFPDEWQEGVWVEYIDLKQATKWLESTETNAQASNEPSNFRAHELGRICGADYAHIAKEPDVLQSDCAKTPHVLTHPQNEPIKTETLVSIALPTTEKFEETAFKLEHIQPSHESSISEDPSFTNETGIHQQILSSSSTSHNPAITDTTLDFISDEQRLDLTILPPTMSPHMGPSVIYGSSPAPAEPRSTRAFPSLSPFLENFTRYSPAHLTDIKNAFRCSRSPAISTIASLGIRTSTEYSSTVFESPTKIENEVSAQFRGKLPGELLTSQHNILPHRPGCPDAYVESFPKRFCDNCRAHFLSGLFDDGHAASREEQEAFCFRSSSEELEDLDRFGNTFLHLIAALGPSLKSLEVALWRHSNINAVNTAGQTFMHILDPCNVLLCMERLFGTLEHRGFNFDQRDVYGKTFLHALVEKGFSFSEYWAEPYVRLLQWKDSTGISREVQVGSLLRKVRFEEIVEDETDLHSKQRSSPDHSSWRDLHKYDDQGRTELHRYLASPDGRYCTSLRKLRELTPISNQRNSAGWSPLHYSIRFGDIDTTEFLLRNGANVHARDNCGRGVLATAHIQWAASGDKAKFLYALRNDETQYPKIEACKAIAIDAGAVMKPSFFDEWDLPAGDHDQDPKTIE